jgi:hypothetical protein
VEPHATPAATRGPQPCPHPDHAITKTDSKTDTEHKGSNTPEQSKHLKYAVLGSNYLMTHDNGYPVKQVIEGVTVQRPAVVWPETLFEQYPSPDNNDDSHTASAG